MTTLDPNIATAVRQSFDNQTMMKTIGASLIDLDLGSVEIHVPIGPGVLQQQGFAHGGLAFSIGDSAAGYSALTVMKLNWEVLTIELKINYLAPATGSALIARGRVIKPGRRIVVTAADVFAKNEEGGETHVAALQGTMMAVAP